MKRDGGWRKRWMKEERRKTRGKGERERVKVEEKDLEKRWMG